jgi:uncharacterized membrane protein YraQ (UPF0718 family)
VLLAVLHLVIGLLIAGAIGAWVPESFWRVNSPRVAVLTGKYWPRRSSTGSRPRSPK